MENNLTESSKIRSVFFPLNRVTPLSKFLAMLIFIISPFFGGFIGYSLAPEKIVEGNVQSLSTNSTQSEVGEVTVYFMYDRIIKQFVYGIPFDKKGISAIYEVEPGAYNAHFDYPDSHTFLHSNILEAIFNDKKYIEYSERRFTPLFKGTVSLESAKSGAYGIGMEDVTDVLRKDYYSNLKEYKHFIIDPTYINQTQTENAIAEVIDTKIGLFIFDTQTETIESRIINSDIFRSTYPFLDFTYSPDHSNVFIDLADGCGGCNLSNEWVIHLGEETVGYSLPNIDNFEWITDTTFRYKEITLTPRDCDRALCGPDISKGPWITLSISDLK